VDFSLSEEQQSIQDLTDQILKDMVSLDRLKEMRENGEHLDHKTWSALANANLVGIAIPEAYGGSGLGFMEACIALEQIGRHVAPVPYYPTVVLGSLPVAQFGTPAQKEELLPAVANGDLIMTAALLEAGAPPDSPTTMAHERTGSWRLFGRKDFVASGLDAGRMVISAATDHGPALFLVDPEDSGVDVARQMTTTEIPEARVELDGANAQYLAGGDALHWTTQRATAALCAIAIGVCDVAVQLTAQYTSVRTQFDRPIATFQAVGQRAADAYIDSEAVRLTSWQACWRLAEGFSAASEVATAKFWAAEGGQRVVAAAQHLHGGIGVDRDYPLHRYFLWAKWIQLNLGGALQHLRSIGLILADGPR
jgi:3-oxocholest-4-en-26-oyl-CoA dehydrogenase beta subunit